MDWKSSLAKSLCIAAMTFAMATTAHAAALRTFVSGFGNDSNTATNCSHAQPCRTFAMAVTVTASGGEIEALDPAGYGPITITGPLTLVGLPGAAINAPSGGNGITINAGPNDAVHVQGLLIDGSGVGADGILFNTGGSLKVFDCTIKNFLYNGIYVGALNGMSLLVTNTVITGISSTANSSGVYFYNGSSAGLSVAALDNLTLSDNSVGISLYAIGGPVEALISNSQILNSPVGLVTQGLSSNTAAVTVALKGDRFNLTTQGIHLAGYTAAYLSQVTQFTAPGLTLGISMDGAGNSALADGTNHFTSTPGVTFGTWISQ